MGCGSRKAAAHHVEHPPGINNVVKSFDSSFDLCRLEFEIGVALRIHPTHKPFSVAPAAIAGHEAVWEFWTPSTF